MATYTPQQLSAQASWIQNQSWLNTQYTVDSQGNIVSSTTTTPRDSAKAPTYPYSLVNIQNGLLPGWLVPVAGLAILLVLANTSLFKPITIILVGIIALWLMNG